MILAFMQAPAALASQQAPPKQLASSGGSDSAPDGITMVKVMQSVEDPNIERIQVGCSAARHSTLQRARFCACHVCIRAWRVTTAIRYSSM